MKYLDKFFQKFFVYQFILIVIIAAFGILSSCRSDKYAKNLKEIHIGSPLSLLIERVGEPVNVISIQALHYPNNHVVEISSNDKVYDYHVDSNDKSIKEEKIKRKDRKNQIHKNTILDVRIGMSKTEVSEILGDPDSISTYQLYFYKKYQIITIDNDIVTQINLHAHANLEKLDKVRLNFDANGLTAINITLAFIMFGVALGIKLESFKKMFYNPTPVIVGFVSQFFVLPALTFLLILVIKPTPSVAMGMILVAACPGGNISNFMSSMAKGNIALSVSLTAIATLVAIFMTPLNFSFWGNLYSNTSGLIMPIKIDAFEMIKTVLILLGIPVVVGISFAYKFPKITEKINKPIRNVSVIFFLAIIILALTNNFNYFLEYIHLIVLIVLAHNILALLTGYSISSIFRLSQEDRRSITIETGIQNSGLGLVLIFNPKLFDGLGGMAFIAAWWGIWHIISGLGLATFWSKRKLKSEKETPIV